jgi:hypothetical protein
MKAKNNNLHEKLPLKRTAAVVVALYLADVIIYNQRLARNLYDAARAV